MTAILGALMPKSFFKVSDNVVILPTRKGTSIWASAFSKGRSSVAKAMRIMSFTIIRNGAESLKCEKR